MKPGMYVATVRGVVGVRVYGPSKTGNWVTVDDDGMWDRLEDGHVEDARPLVSLDAVDGADVDRVSKAFRVSRGHASDGLLLLVTASPDEPLALGAVVPLHDGGHAVRIATLPSCRTAWALVDAVGMPGDCCSWSEVVQLIEPGWTQ